MSKRLENKVAIVTGASKGIGAEIAKHLAAEGASVVVNYSSSKEQAERVVSEITHHGGKAIAIQGNVAKEEDIQNLFSKTIDAFGKLDILINNAGIYNFMPLEEITPEAFYEMFNLNVLGLLLACREAAKHFGDSGGVIINISSVSSTDGMPTGAIYNSTKAAVDAITKTLGKELGGRKIRVNSVNPGLVETEGTHHKHLIEEKEESRIQETPLGRIGQPEDIAPAVVFLVSDEASWITAERLFISGGRRN